MIRKIQEMRKYTDVIGAKIVDIRANPNTDNLEIDTNKGTLYISYSNLSII